MEKLSKNDVIKVTVTGVQKYGAFVNTNDENLVPGEPMPMLRQPPMDSPALARAASTASPISPTTSAAGRWARVGTVSYTHLDVYKRQVLYLCFYLARKRGWLRHLLYGQIAVDSRFSAAV